MIAAASPGIGSDRRSSDLQQIHKEECEKYPFRFYLQLSDLYLIFILNLYKFKSVREVIPIYLVYFNFI